ncbi:MAG: ABC transporter substrate-binding protein, partial [Firmicutes bacterium]|nr:ABC transporter substrate-binding protein [Bacillota bacterium]NMB01598.1 ABC transporter substrate-binding protein [Bacillota bacterium]
LPTVAKYTQSLALLAQDNLVNFIAGGDDLKNYDNFVDAWKVAGGQESTIEVNNWYQSR